MRMVEKVTVDLEGQDVAFGTIVHLEDVVQRCPLTPLYGEPVDTDMDCTTVLEEFSEFLINPFASLLDYDMYKIN